MATSGATLTQRVRRYLRDWPDQDALTAAVNTTNTTLVSVADGTRYTPNWLIQIDDEAMQVSVANPTSLTVRRAMNGSAATLHSAGASILIRPGFLNGDILDALNAALDACWPLIYRPVASEFTGDTSTAYEYAIPNMTTIARPIPYLSQVHYKAPGSPKFFPLKGWRIVRGDTPLIRLTTPLFGGGTLRFVGYGPFAHLTTSSDVLDGFYPANAEDLLVEYAAQRLLISGEAGRVRFDVGARDDREAANRPGSAAAAANAVWQRWQTRLRAAAMPPLQPHMVTAADGR